VSPASDHAAAAAKALSQRFADGLSACLISDGVPEARVLEPGLLRLAGPAGFVGPAVTVHAPDADNLAVWEAIARAASGSVLAIATAGNRASAILGGNVGRAMHAVGIVAVVTDGLIRDVDEMPEALAVHAAGVTPRSPARRAARPQAGRVPIAGAPIADGDIVVGDGNGIVVLSPPAAQALVRRLDELLEAERRQAARFADAAEIRRFLDRGGFRPS
jgi:4-hydroxy-4-methyl-2-oxoglutarate aldolase